MSRRVRVYHLDIHRKRLKGNWYADTSISKFKSILGNTVDNVYTQGKFFKVYPIVAQRESGQSLIGFTDDVGVPYTLLTDGAGEFTGNNTEFVKHARLIHMQIHNSEQVRHNHNHAVEREIGFLSKCCIRLMTKKVIPKRLWNFGIFSEAEILSRISRGEVKRAGYK